MSKHEEINEFILELINLTNDLPSYRLSGKTREETKLNFRNLIKKDKLRKEKLDKCNDE